MDKVICYPGQIPLDTHLLQPQRNTELALGYTMQALFGSATVIDGLAVTQQGSPNMTVQVGAGAIITSTTVDPTGVAFGSLALDATNLVKIGINKSAVNMSALTAPGTAGQSQNWLVEAQFLEADGTPTVLAYYNAANPAVPYSGPANAGTSQNTKRANSVQFQWKAGTAAATGSQNTPSPDSGWIGIAVVTVANGQSSITSANIAPYVSAVTVTSTKLPVQRKRLLANLTLYVASTGGNDSNSGLASWHAFATLQKAWDSIITTYDLNGFTITIQCAAGSSFTAGLIAQGLPVGTTNNAAVVIAGNGSSIGVSSGNCITAQYGAVIAVSGFTLGNTSGSGIFAQIGGQVSVNSGMTFAGCPNGFHMWASNCGIISINAGYTISNSAVSHIFASASSLVNGGGYTVTISAACFFTNGFVVASLLGTVNQVTVTYANPGNVTSTARYSAVANGVISNGGSGGPNYFPGSTAGSVATGGAYYG